MEMYWDQDTGLWKL